MFDDDQQPTIGDVPEDMFASVAEDVPNVAPPTKEAGPTPEPISMSKPVASSTPSVTSMPSEMMNSDNHGFPWKSVGVVLFVLVLISLAVGISYYALSTKVKIDDNIPDLNPITNPTEIPPIEVVPEVKTPPVVKTPVDELPIIQTPEPVPEPTPEPVPEPTPEPVPEPTPEPVPVDDDRDKDGLTDLEEATAGTSPTNPDTDNDGLSDREEIKVYNTNPLDPDTDADTYVDGEEVKNGYNPNGPGKLLVVPTDNIPS